MHNLGLIRAFLQQATAHGSRSNVLKPIAWMISLCMSATLAAAYLGLASWIAYMFAVFCGSTMLLYLGAYIYCLGTDKDALRSETYTIQKMAIEKGFMGDSLSGVIRVNETDKGLLLQSTSDEESGEDK